MSASAPILVIGRNGQLARALQETGRNIVAVDRAALDLSWDAETLAGTLNYLIPNPCAGVILAAAYTQVDQAEKDHKLAMAINGVAPRVIARVCAERILPLVHISTDYVFDGNGRAPYPVNTPTDPINVYGQTKRAGEIAILGSGANSAILRTSWVYDGSGRNFLTTMLRLAQTRDQISVVNDQKGRPTYAPDLAEAALKALDGLCRDPSVAGLYHYSNSGDVISWADFAAAIFSAAGSDTRVVPIPSCKFPTPATRPAYSALDISAFEQTFKAKAPNWKDGLERAMRQVSANSVA